MHEAAVRKHEKSDSPFDFREFEESIEAGAEMEKVKPDAFLSSEEILMAIILYHYDWFFKINYNILKYKVDFYIPDHKIIVEIDSALHDIGKCRAKDGRRDVEIRNELGAEWEIIRIPSSYVCKYPKKLCEGLLELANKQRQIRQKNGGFLPTSYSKSVKAYYEEVLKK
jgi:very-short-patch-repair endonuclease